MEEKLRQESHRLDDFPESAAIIRQLIRIPHGWADFPRCIMPFTQLVSIASNEQLRIPQRDGWAHIRNHFEQPDADREVGLVLPVGCGKSGLICLAPFALQACRVLVIAPGTRIRGQLGDDLRSNSPSNFYQRFGIIGADQDFPETAVIESGRVNMDDILHCHVAVANIQQIAGEENRWLVFWHIYKSAICPQIRFSARHEEYQGLPIRQPR